jgi:hypothetical protein
VLVVERGRRVGGACVHTGTIPSKTLRETVLNLSGWRERGFYGRAHRNKDDITAEDRLSISYIQGVARIPSTFDYVAAIDVRSERNTILRSDAGPVAEVPCHVDFLETAELPGLTFAQKRHTTFRPRSRRQCLQHSLRVVLDCPQESLRGSCWFSPSLLPVSQRSNIDVKKFREFRLA